MGFWYLLYIVACVVNGLLIAAGTDLRGGDALYWLWILIPALAYSSGYKVAERKGE